MLSRLLSGLVAMVLSIAGCGMMATSLGGETIEANLPIVLAAAGAGFATSGVLIYISISVDRMIKELQDLRRSVDHNTGVNIEIAKRQMKTQSTE